MDAVGHRGHLYGVRRESAVRVDAVRQSHRREVPLGTARHPGSFHPLRVDGDLADSRRRLSRRPLRAALGRHRRRRYSLPWRGSSTRARLSAGSVFRRRVRRCRHRVCLRDLCRQRAQVVSRAARARRRHYRGGLRRGRRDHDRADPAHDQQVRLRAGVSDLRSPAGRHRVRGGLGPVGRARPTAGSEDQTQSDRRTATPPPRCCAAPCST